MKTKMKTRRKTPSRGLDALAAMGRFGDTEVANVAPGEMVIPKGVMDGDPSLRQHVTSTMSSLGRDPAQYTVGHPRNSRNPRSGAREFADMIYTDRGWVDAGTGQNIDFNAPPANPYSPQPAAGAYDPHEGKPQGQSVAGGIQGRIDAQFGPGGAPDPYADNSAPDQGGGDGANANPFSLQPRRSMVAAAAPSQDWGSNANATVNQGLAGQTGYTGDFGAGQFNSWIASQPYATQEKAATYLAQQGQPERIAWGSNQFLDEQPYVNGAVPAQPFAPRPPPAGGIQDMGPGYSQYDFGSGQDQIQNFVDYYNQYGVVPAGTRFDTQANNTSGLFMPATGKPVDSSWAAMAGLSDAEWANLTRSIGVDPNSPDAWLAVENQFGLGRQVEDPNWRGGARDQPIYDANGQYVGLTGRVNEGDAFSTGYVTLGSWPNVVQVPMADILSGKVNVNSVEMALSAGYDPEGFEGSTNTLDAAAQIFRGMPGLDRTPLNSAEFNTLRKPLEAATPGFWQQVENRTARQVGQGRTIPNELRGSSDLNAILGGNTTYSSTNGGALTGNRVGASAPPPVGGANGTGGGGPLDYSRNDAGWDRGSELISQSGDFGIWKHPSGSLYYSTANGEYELLPQANGLYLDTMVGLLRNGQGIFVNPDGSPMVTDFSRSYYGNAGTSDPMRLLGSTDLNARIGSFKGVDLTTLRDGNNTPIRGNYGGGGGVSTAPVTTGGGGTNTGGGTTNTGSNGTTQTGTGLTPGEINPWSLIQFLMTTGGMGGLNINLGNGQTQTPLTGSTSNPYGLLNSGYYMTPGGYPVYTSGSTDETQGGGIGAITNNKQTVDFRNPFSY